MMPILDVKDMHKTLMNRIVPPISNEVITLARIIALQEVICAGQAFMKGSHGISGAIWPFGAQVGRS